MSDYRGPEQIGWTRFPGRGTTYHGDFDGHDVQVYVTEKRKRVRVFVDGQEYKQMARGGSMSTPAAELADVDNLLTKANEALRDDVATGCGNESTIDKAATYLINRSQDRGQSTELCIATQLLKVQEESGEAATILVRMLTASTLQDAMTKTSDLIDELCDVTISSMVTLSMVGGEEWPKCLADRTRLAVDRLITDAGAGGQPEPLYARWRLNDEI